MRLHKFDVQFFGQRGPDEHPAKTGDDQVRALARGQTAFGKGQRIVLRVLAHLRQDRQEVALLQQFAHFRALRNRLRVAFNGPKFHVMRLNPVAKVFMRDEAHLMTGGLQALAQREIRFNVAAATRGNDGNSHDFSLLFEIDQPALERREDGLRAIVGVQLRQDGADVIFHGAFAQRKLLRDFFIG